MIGNVVIWCDDTLIQWYLYDHMMISWYDDIMIWRCDDMMIWWYHDMMIWWYGDMTWCDDVMPWWHDDMMWYDVIMTWGSTMILLCWLLNDVSPMMPRPQWCLLAMPPQWCLLHDASSLYPERKKNHLIEGWYLGQISCCPLEDLLTHIDEYC